MTVSEYTVSSSGRARLRIALVSDLHGRPFAEALAAVRAAKPDIIAAAGDILEPNSPHTAGFDFLKECLAVAPVYYICGNHEAALGRDMRAEIRRSGIYLLDDGDMPSALTPDMPSFSEKLSCEVHIGGIVSAYCAARRREEREMGDGNGEGGNATCGGRERRKIRGKRRFTLSRFSCRDSADDIIDEERLRKFSALDGYKIIICHHPEYYPRCVKDLPVDLMLSGHAHGGQVRIFGQGLFSPGQGFFPKYTAGICDGRLAVSRGLANHSTLPRIFNPPEVVILNIVR